MSCSLPALVFVDTRTNAKSFVVKVRGKNPEHAVFTPDGRRVFASAEDGAAVDVVDVARRRQVGQSAVGERPRGIAFSAGGKRAFVTAEGSNEKVADIAGGKLPWGVVAR